MKKILSAALSFALCLTMALPAFAAPAGELVEFEVPGRPMGYLEESGFMWVVNSSDEGGATINYLVNTKTGKLVKQLPYLRVDGFYDGISLASDLDANYQIENYLVDAYGNATQIKGYESVFRGGENLLIVSKDGKYGCVDYKLNPVIPLEYDNIDQFRDGLAIVSKDYKRGAIDVTGKLVIPCQFEDLYDFSEGMAVFGKYDEAAGKNLMGYVDKTGRVVVPAKYDRADPFQDGMARVTTMDENYNSFYTILDKTGKEIISRHPGTLGSCSEGMIRFQETEGENKGRWGFMDLTGAVVIPARYSDVYDFSEGMAAVTDANGVTGYIDAAGNQAIPMQYIYGQSFENGLALADEGPQTIIIDKTGRNLQISNYPIADIVDNWAVVNTKNVGGEWEVEEYYGVIPMDKNTPSGWAQTFIDSAAQQNILPISFEYRYQDNCSRAEFCELAVKLYESLKGEITQRKTFVDTTDVNVEKMAGLDVIKGMGDGIFAPDQNLSREQASAILSNLAKALGKELPAADPTFADNAQISSWAKDFVGRVQAAGIMSGVGGNKFAPQSPYTREQCVITMVKLAAL